MCLLLLHVACDPSLPKLLTPESGPLPCHCSPGPDLELTRGYHPPAPAESVSRAGQQAEKEKKPPHAPQAPQRAPAWRGQEDGDTAPRMFILAALAQQQAPGTRTPAMPISRSAPSCFPSNATHHLLPSHPLCPREGCYRHGHRCRGGFPRKRQEQDETEVTTKRNHQDAKDEIAKPRGICVGFKDPSASWAQRNHAPAAPSFALQDK